LAKPARNLILSAVMHDDIPSLTQGLARCDERAWREFHERYHDFLHGLAVARGVVPCDAPDLIQRVYLRVLRHPKVFASADAFSGWLACLVRCEAVDAASSRNRRAWLTERFQQWIEARTPEPEHPQAEQLAVAMAQLPDNDRAMVRQHYFHGWSHQRIAIDCRISVKAVESKLARLRKRLRQHLCP
jgi:RNA polymerase sigma factor (sigma-70 family)